MRQVAILGIGQTIVDEQWEKSLREIAGEAAFAAMTDSGLQKTDGLFVGNMLSSIVDGQSQLGTFIADWVGLWQQEAVKVEAACASGGAAFRAGVMAVASGEIDSALIVGVEKMTDQLGRDVTAGLATAADADYEVEQGISFVGINALIMRRYMHEYGWKHIDFAPFSVNAHANAVHNPYARLQDGLTVEQFEKSGMIASPINLMDASPIGDGAAAIIVVPAEQLHSLSGRPRIVVAGSASATDTIAVHSRRDPLFLTAAYQSSKRAFEMAGLTQKDIDFFELHDASFILLFETLWPCGARPGARLGAPTRRAPPRRPPPPPRATTNIRFPPPQLPTCSKTSTTPAARAPHAPPRWLEQRSAGRNTPAPPEKIYTYILFAAGK